MSKLRDEVRALDRAIAKLGAPEAHRQEVLRRGCKMPAAILGVMGPVSKEKRERVESSWQRSGPWRRGATFYMARTQPARHGYPDLNEGWGLWKLHADAETGHPERIEMFYERKIDADAFVASLAKQGVTVIEVGARSQAIDRPYQCWTCYALTPNIADLGATTRKVPCDCTKSEADDHRARGHDVRKPRR